MSPTDLWLLGHGIAASPSPQMQNAALRARGVEGSYRIVDVAPAELAGALARLRDGAAAGANVTIPHKVAVAAACDRLEGDAALTGAVNTVVVEGGRLLGANTDAAGLEGALRHAGLWPARGSEAVVLGAGGAAAAALLALSRAPVERLWLSARRPEAACALAARLAPALSATAAPWDHAALEPLLARAGTVVNATPSGLDGLPLRVDRLGAGCGVVDLRYRPRPVDLVAAARRAGLRACDGLEMLLHQGMLSFRRWTGLEPPWEEARAALLAAVGG
ncbi:MAG TPA: shikimate dehydrogenase [Candidatus Dormibacteraeota bacterium]|jgi:shikimate dehydrogenase|nr:shikimate dehydrogenase [Candidatus Dormibacteraeota bacterium]